MSLQNYFVFSVIFPQIIQVTRTTSEQASIEH